MKLFEKLINNKALAYFSCISAIFLFVFFFVYLFSINFEKHQDNLLDKQLETNNKIQIFFVNEHQFELEYIVKRIQHSDNCPKCKATTENFPYSILIFDDNQPEISNTIEGYFNNGK